MSDLSPLYAPHGVSDPAIAHQQAIVALGNLVKQQALVMGFSDAFASDYDPFQTSCRGPALENYLRFAPKQSGQIGGVTTGSVGAAKGE